MIVAEAREWVNTPFAWQQSAKGAGCDCKGLLAGIARELGRPEAASLYAQMADYGPHFDGQLLKRGIAETFDPVEDMQPGYVLLCKWNEKPGHTAIYEGEGRAISAMPKSGVKSRSLRALFFYYPLDSIWRWR